MGKVVGLAFVSAESGPRRGDHDHAAASAPQRLMLGYWFGAMLTSVTLGVVIVFTLEGSGFEQSSKNTAHPAIALTLAGLLLLVVLVLATGRDKPFEERRRTRKEQKESPRWQRWMQKGDPKITFVIGVLLSFPGASYLVALELDTLSKLHYSTFATVLVVIGFCLVELVVLEILLVAFTFASEQTPVAIDRAKAWAGARWRTIAIWGVAVIAAGLAVNGIAELL